MVAAVYEARMTREQAEQLAELVAVSRPDRPAGILNVTLVHEDGVGGLLAVWKDKDTLDRYLSVTPVPRATELMHAVGVEPAMRVVDVLECS